MEKFYFILGDSVSDYIYSDLKNDPDVTVIEKIDTLRDKFLKRIRAVHFRENMNTFFELPFKQIWYKYNEISKISFEQNVLNYLVFTNVSIGSIDINSLRKLQAKGVKIIVLLFDTLSMPAACRAKQLLNRFNFDLVLTYDPADAQKYNYYYYNCLFSKFPVDKTEVTTDLYFAGTEKGRLNLLLDIYKKMTGNLLTCDFTINKVNENNQMYRGKIKYNYVIPYPEIIQNVQNTNCILEILQPGQTGVTLRTYESIVYNKKLLTNNPLIKDFSFYNKNYMKYFKTIEDIDVEWVRRRENIDYKYNNQFSPLNLLKIIRDKLGMQQYEKNKRVNC